MWNSMMVDDGPGQWQDNKYGQILTVAICVPLERCPSSHSPQSVLSVVLSVFSTGCSDNALPGVFLYIRLTSTVTVAYTHHALRVESGQLFSFAFFAAVKREHQAGVRS